MNTASEYARIPFQTEEGDSVLFFVLEQTRFYGVNYLLVTEDVESDEAEVYILKDLSSEDSEESVYEMVDDEEELNAVAGLFEELLEDTDIVKEV